LLAGKPSKPKRAKAGQIPINAIFAKAPKWANSAQPSNTPLCTGLTARSSKRISRYLKVSEAMGGGAPARHNIAHKLFHARLRFLSKKQIKQLVTYEQTQLRWKNDHDNGAIRSSTCSGATDRPDTPCIACASLWKNKVFRNALDRKRKRVPESRLKFINKRYRMGRLHALYQQHSGLKELMETVDAQPGSSQLLRLAQGLSRGRFQPGSIALGLLSASVERDELELAGRRVTGARYTPDVLRFCQAVAAISPASYRIFSSVLALPTLRHLTAVRAKSPRYVLGICRQNVDHAAELLKGGGYSGPLTLATDDTVLKEDLVPFFDESRKKWIVVGGIAGSLEVATEQELTDIMGGDTIVLGTQVIQSRDGYLISPAFRFGPRCLAFPCRASNPCPSPALSSTRATRQPSWPTCTGSYTDICPTPAS
jgi:hypothetical protein